MSTSPRGSLVRFVPEGMRSGKGRNVSVVLAACATVAAAVTLVRRRRRRIVVAS